MKKILFILLLLLPLFCFSQQFGGAGVDNGYQNNTIKYINKITDLPNAVGGEILLDSVTTYEFTSAIVLGTNHLRLQNKTKIVGSNAQSSYLLYTGNDACIRSNGVNVTIQNLTLMAYGGTNTCVFDLRDTNRVCIANIIGTFVMFSDSIGRYYGFEVVNHLTNLWKDCKAGLVFDSVYYASYTNNILRTANGYPHKVISFENIEDVRGYAITNSLWVATNPLDTCLYMASYSLGHTPKMSMLSGCSFIDSTETSVSGFPAEALDNFNKLGNIGTENYYKLGRVTTSLAGTFVNSKAGLILMDTILNVPIYHDGETFRLFSNNEILIKETLFQDNFVSGNFTDSGYVTVNNSVNYWMVGSDDSYDGTYNAYITNDGTNAAYTRNNVEVSHFYKDFTFPSGAEDCNLSFYWKSEGEINYDYGTVYKAPTTYTPSAGTTPVSPAVALSEQLNNNSVWYQSSYELGAVAGTTIRIIWTWRNDGSIGTQPPVQIDKIVITYN